MSAYTTAQLAIYAVLCIPVLFNLVKHGRPGFLGWGYLFAFCSLRIIGSGLSLSHESSANIVSNIGLSPLLLGACGILHEANVYASDGSSKKMEWIRIGVYHLAVAAATGLVGSGASALQGNNPTPDDFTKLKAGIAILVAAWVVLALWTVLALIRTQKWAETSIWRAGVHLQYAVLASLVFIGVRVIYTLIAFVTQDKSISPTTGKLAVRVVLSLLMELITVLIFICGGLWTRNVRHDAQGNYERQQVHKLESPLRSA